MKVISLGWGVQSFTLAAMVALGELEPVDAAIHADTTHEFSGTYEFAKRWTPWLEEHGVKVITVSDPLQAAKVTTDKTDAPFFTQKVVEFGGTPLPAYMTGEGKLMRQCTNRWKITPMRRWISNELEKLETKKAPGTIEQWIGISWDEFQRMHDSDVKYITHRWPLIEKRMTRANCVKWLEVHNQEVPPRSACTFCPFHSTKEWRNIKASPIDWQEAVQVDRAIRKARPPYDLFVHPSREPLEEVDLRTQQEKGQLSLWDTECSGICGI
jgi:3'-phosphoadenosine 5'-phosphosulfate sulfotransferase (PAPS reductase)/FAD synthetase